MASKSNHEPGVDRPATRRLNRGDRTPDGRRQVRHLDSEGPDAADLPSFRLVSADVNGPFEPPQWFWQGRVPLGELTTLGGRGDVGKTTIVLDLAAQLSRGELAGDIGRKGKTLYFSDEASFQQIISPRYAAAGGQPGGLFNMEMLEATGSAGPIARPIRLGVRDMTALAGAVADERIDLIVFDPIDMLLGGIDTHRNNEVRTALGLVKSTGCTVIGIQHLTKGSHAGNVGDRVMGSAAFRNFPRSVLLAQKRKDDSDVIVVAHDKCNYGPRQNSLSLRIVQSHIPGYARVEWLDDDPTSADELMRDQRGPTLVEQCTAWLERFLTDNGPTSPGEALHAAKTTGYGRTTVYEARKRIAATNNRQGLWTL